MANYSPAPSCFTSCLSLPRVSNHRPALRHQEQAASMESLDPECTPLKHRYDSCFNLWFEGYLQPALDARSSTILQKQLNNASGTARLEEAKDGPVALEQVTLPGPSSRRPLVTSWAGAFRPRVIPQISQESPASSSTATVNDPAHTQAAPAAVIAIDTRGKTRSQIKAEEYEAACGSLWRDYQGCLKSAVARNTSLSTLLEQAREEHPLVSQEGLAGTPWDAEPNTR